MIDKETIKQLMADIRRQMNGAVSQAMREFGQKDSINLGVSLPTIKDIAMEYAPNHELAEELSKLSTREWRIAALYIAEPDKLTAEQMQRWSEGWQNYEIARLSAMLLFHKSTDSERVVEQWLAEKNSLREHSALYIAGKRAQFLSQAVVEMILNQSKDFTGRDEIETAAIVYALREIYFAREEYRERIREIAKDFEDLSWQIDMDL